VKKKRMAGHDEARLRLSRSDNLLHWAAVDSGNLAASLATDVIVRFASPLKA
jgi:hypothetical protein